MNQPQYQMPGGVMTQPAPKKKSKAGIIIGAIAGFLVLVVIVAFLVPSPEKKFYGTWKGTVDYTEQVKDRFGDVAQYVDDSFRFEFEIDFTFNNDKTYSYSLNEESFNTNKQVLVNEFTSVLEKSLRATLGDYYTDTQIAEYFESYYGKTIAEYSAEAFKDLTYESINESMSGEGNFKVTDDKLFLSKGKEYQVDETAYDVFVQKSANEIVLTEEYENNVKTSNTDGILPLTLIKQ